MNDYEGWSEKDLLDLRTRLQRRSASGSVTRSSIAGLMVEKTATSGASQLVERKKVQYALWLIGEKKAAEGGDANPYENPYTATIKRTRTQYV
jgi:hypothetical protein